MTQISAYSEPREWLSVTGVDAERFLQGMLTCDVKRMTAAGLACAEGHLLDLKGRSLAPIVVLHEPSSGAAKRFLLSVPAGRGEAILQGLDRYLVADEVELALVPTHDAPTCWIVPEFDDDVNLDRALIESIAPDALDQVWMVTAESWGWRLPRAVLSRSHEEFWIRPAQKIKEPVRMMSDSEFNTLRVRAGVPAWGIDYDSESLVLELPLMHTISYNKGCYIGQEVIARATYRGHMNKGLARFESSAPLEAGSLVYSELDPSRAVGKITSVADKIGLGMIRFVTIDEALAQGKKLFQSQKDGTKAEITNVKTRR